MNVLVDTCIWSLAFRRKAVVENSAILKLRELIKDSRAQIIGPIRQELLSGIKSQEQCQLLSEHLRAFEDIPLKTEDFELAANFFNSARQKGIQGSNTDFLICAVSKRLEIPIFTIDKDFYHYNEILPIELFETKLIHPIL